MQTIKTEKITWIDIKGPGQPDLEHLQANFDLHPLVLKEILPQIDYPKVENFGDYLFLVVFYPFFDKETSSTIPFELDLIIGKNFLITNHYRDIVPLSALFHECNLYPEKMKNFCDEGPGELLYRIVNEILQACFPKIGHIKQNIDEIEKIIFKKENKKAIDKIASVKRDIIGFERILNLQKLVLENLITESEKFFSKHLIPYFHNLLNTFNQVKNLLETNEKTLLSLEDTNQSLIDNRTNEIVKALTIFSILLYPFAFFSDLFSMNGQFFQWTMTPHELWLAYGLMLAGVLTIFLTLKRKNWL